MPEAARTLVKSPPELWAEVSDPQSLTRHLGAFGEIRITRLDPEATVAWEGDRIRGTVDLQPAGWGTKVTVTAEELAVAEEPPPPEDPVPEAEAVEEVEERERRGLRALLARLFGGREAPPEPGPEPDPEPEPEPEPEPPAASGPDPTTVLDGMLGSLGAAHHRPFSR